MRYTGILKSAGNAHLARLRLEPWHGPTIVRIWQKAHVRVAVRSFVKR
jgi:hypothetical protein